MENTQNKSLSILEGQIDSNIKKEIKIHNEEKSIAGQIKNIWLNKDLEDYTFESYVSLSKYFLDLGDINLQKKAYTKAAALYNFVLTIQRDKLKVDSQNTEQKLLEAEQQLLNQICNGVAPKLNLDEHHDEISRNKAELEKIEKLAKAYIVEKFKGLSENLDEDENQKMQTTRKVFQAIANEMKAFIKNMLKNCYKVLGKPSCQYAIIGLGSLAREEMTPYSDFEWAILIEEGKDTEEVKQYFRNLTELLHLKVINLGKTILPSMAIPALNNFYSKNPLDNWFYDEITPRGFAFDGAMPGACKTPLGELREDGSKLYELIATPTQLAEFQKCKDESLEEKHLPQVLTNVTFIDGSKDLFNIYKELLAKNTKDIRDRALNTLSKNCELFNPDLGDQNQEGKLYDVKKEIYRMPSLLIDGLAHYYNIHCASNWDKIDELSKKGIINDKAKENLCIALSIAAQIRLIAYDHYKGQQEKMAATILDVDYASNNLELIQKEFEIPDINILYQLYYRILPLYFKVDEFINSAGSRNDRFFATDSFYDNSSKVKGIIAKRLLHYKEAEEEFKKDNKDSESYNYLAILAMMQGKYSDAEGYISNANDINEQCINNDIMKIKILINHANLYYSQGKYQEAKNQICKAESLFESIKKKDTSVLKKLKLTIAQTKGIILQELCEFDETQKIFEELIKIFEQDTKYKQSGDLIITLNNLGRLHLQLYQVKEAEAYLIKAYTICTKIYGSKIHPNIIMTKLNLADVYKNIDNQKAVQFYIELEVITRNFHGSTHPAYATVLNDYGVLLAEMNENKQAKVYYKKALEIRKQNHSKNLLHPHLVSTLINLSEFEPDCEAELKKISEKQISTLSVSLRISIYNQLGCFYMDKSINMSPTSNCKEFYISKAHGFFEQALDITKAFYGCNHPIYASLKDNIGVLNVLLKPLEEALIIRRNIYGNNPHPGLINSLINISSWYLKKKINLDHISIAIKYLEQARELNKNLHGKLSQNNEKKIQSNMDAAEKLLKDKNPYNFFSNGKVKKISIEAYNVYYFEVPQNPYSI